jgi:hypothetical protein
VGFFRVWVRAEVVFRDYDCLFKELALRCPEMVCDVMDVGRMFGMTKALERRVKPRRLKCAGHNDRWSDTRFSGRPKPTALLLKLGNLTGHLISCGKKEIRVS